MPSDDADAFLAFARGQIVDAHIKIALHSVSPAKEMELWRAVDALDALIKMQARSFEAQLELIDREIEDRFRR